MTRKLQILIAINALLFLGILFSFWVSMGNSGEGPRGQQAVFALTDSSQVNRIRIGEQEFTRISEGNWRLNQNMAVNPKRIFSLLSVLSKVEIKRPVTEDLANELFARLEKEAIPVSVFAGNDLLLSYLLMGDGQETYAISEDGQQFYAVHLPGMMTNLYRLFNIKPAEWRDKRLLYTTWRTMQKLQVTYPGDRENTLRIAFDSVFYKVEGVNKLDSAKLFTYIQQYQDFEVESFITPTQSLRDSLRRGTLICTIDLEDLYEERDNTLDIIMLNNDLIFGFSRNTHDTVKINARMLRNYLVSRKEFEKER